MNNSALHLHKLEANLKRLQARVPDFPISGVFLSRLIQHLGRGMSSLLDLEVKPFGLGEAEFRVLMTLFSQTDGVAHPTDLCVKTSQSPANMSRISDALVARDLITRVASVHDRRKMVLRITEQGEELVRRLLPVLSGPLRDLFSDFSEHEQHELIAQLKRLGAKVDQALAERSGERLE